MTYRTILVELVNGPSDDGALAATRALAERFGATAHAVHVAALPVVPAAHAEPAAFTSPELPGAQEGEPDRTKAPEATELDALVATIPETVAVEMLLGGATRDTMLIALPPILYAA